MRSSKLIVEIAIAAAVIFLVLFWSLAQGALLHGHLMALDTSVLHTITLIRSSGLTGLMLFFTYLGNWQVIISLELLLLIIFALYHRRRSPLLFIVALVIGEAASLFFKYMTGRDRPEDALLSLSGSTSFPSGHALVAVVVYGLIAYLLCYVFREKWQKVLITLGGAVVIFMVGISRVYLGVHWLSDVIGGWLLGFVVLVGLVFLYEKTRMLFEKERPVTFKNKKLLFIVAAAITVEIGFIFYFFLTNPVT